MTPQSYPLQWPEGWPREGGKEKGAFKSTLAGALNMLRDELNRLGATNLVLSSNCSLGHERPKDPGVVAYFTLKGRQMAIPCDRWQLVEHNVKAIALTIESMRGMDRWGAKHMIYSIFSGFTALPAPSTAPSWWDVIGCRPDATIEEVKNRYWEEAKKRHPDHGGTTEEMAKLNAAFDAFKRERQS